MINIPNVSCNAKGIILELQKLIFYSAGNLSAVTMDDFQLALCHTVPSLYRGSEGMVELPPVNWDDIGGLEPVKIVLKQVCFYIFS